MPNIIEQQDLLKGLPDARIALLLKNPVGDIPPFLVAAEAQRRQAIRQQFSGGGTKESVVDTLTKQMAKVPENIRAASATPPVIPPTPDMQGVAALQQQQAIQQAAQQGGDQQQMRHGGIVQRYADGSLVGGSYYVDPFGIPDVPVGEIPDEYSVDKFAQKILPPSLYPRWEAPGTSEKEAAEKKRQKKEDENKFWSDVNKFIPQQAAPPTDEQMAANDEQSRLKRVYEQYAASRKPGEAPDEMRQKIEELYKYQEPSDWEKAQRWFAMSAQFLDPSKTTMQSLAGAANEFANAAAEDRRAKREAELTGKAKLLEYDINNAQRLQDAEQKKADREWETQQKILERRNPGASDVLKTLDTMITSLNDKIAKASEIGSMSDPEYVKNLIAQRDAYIMQQAEILKTAGYGLSGGTVTEDQLRSSVKALQAGKQ